MNKFDYKNLTPFKWFVLENFPFLEADFDALTEWQLFCKLGKEINKIIDSQNTVGSEMEKFTQAFIELKNFVDNYFNNLDVQEEINNKLNDMVEDGTMNELIAPYLDKFTKLLNQERNSRIENEEIERNARISSDNNLQNQINSLASGSPKGIFPTVEDLISNNPNTGVYIVQSNGHIYSWTKNGQNAIDLGPYQAREIANGSITKNMTDFLKSDDFQLFDKNTAIPKKFIYAPNGQEYTATDPGMYWASDFIEIQPNRPYVASDMSQQVAFYDENKDYLVGFNYSSSGRKTPYLSPSTAKYMRVTIKDNLENYVLNQGGTPNYFTPFLKIIEEYPYLDKRFLGFKRTDNILNPLRILNNYYDNVRGEVVPTVPTQGSEEYYFTDFIPLAFNEYLSSNHRIRQVGEYDENFKFLEKNFLSGIKTYKYTPNNVNTKYIRITINNDIDINKITMIYGNYDDVEFIPYLIPNIDEQSIYKNMLNDELTYPLKNKKITFLGDSITYGYDGANPNNRVNLPYPQIIQNLTKSKVTNLGINGSTISGNGQQVDNEYHNGYSPMNIRIQDVNPNQDYLFVFGGTNDYGSRSSLQTIGEITDTTNQTFYGSLNIICDYYYNNFVQNNMKLIFITPIKRTNGNTPNSAGYKLEDYVNAIKEVGKKYSIPVIDLYTMSEIYPDNLNFKNNFLPDGLHPNQNLYYKLANIILKYL